MRAHAFNAADHGAQWEYSKVSSAVLPPFPLSSRGVYQVVVVVPEGDTVAEAHAAEFSRALASAMTGLGMTPAKTLVCFDRIVPLDPDRRQPCVGVFFGSVEGPKLRATDIDRLDLLVEDGRVVIPVVEDLRRLRLMAPGGIAHLNGLERRECGADFERLASRVLEGFGLLRERRRLFISYRRTESSGVATQ